MPRDKGDAGRATFHRVPTGLRCPVFGLLVACVLAGLAVPVRAASKSTLARRIDTILADDRLEGARVGVHIVDVDSGRELYSLGASEQFIPASNQKLVTAATALLYLGSDYRFNTRLCSRGRFRDDGVLQGDLIVCGHGDPAIGGEHEPRDALEEFGQWAMALQKRGVRRVTGDVVADDTFFDRQHVHPGWPRKQLWKPYCAPVSALSANDNCVHIRCLPGKEPGSRARLSLVPDVPIVGLRNVCRTSSSKHLIWFYRHPGSRTVSVGGHIRADSAGYKDDVTVRDPALYTAMLLREALRRRGIPVEGEVRLATEADLKKRNRWHRLDVLRHDLTPVLKTMVTESQNHYAEQVIKTVGAKRTGRGTWESGQTGASRFLHHLAGGQAEFTLSDGSGMSRKNRLSPALITSLLRFMANSRLGDTYGRLLARAGEEGTLDSRLEETPYTDAIRAKTGYLSGVGALSGYARATSGREVVFSVLINDFRGGGNTAMKQIEDAIARAVVDLAR